MPETFIGYALKDLSCCMGKIYNLTPGRSYNLASSSFKTSTIGTFYAPLPLYQSYDASPAGAICLHPSAYA